MLAFQPRPTGLDPDDEEHEDRRDRGEPEREDTAGGEERDHGQDHLGHHQEDDRFAGRPAEGDEPMEHVVVAVLEQ